MKVRRKDLEIALGRNRNAEKCSDFTEIKSDFSVRLGFQSFAQNLPWDRSIK